VTDKLTPDAIHKARELCEAATPGPWRVFYWDGHHNIHADDLPNRGDPEDGFACVYGYSRDENGNNAGKVETAGTNADFIAAAREGWPAALDEVGRLSDVIKIVCNSLETLVNDVLVNSVRDQKPVGTKVEETITVLRLARKAVENY